MLLMQVINVQFAQLCLIKSSLCDQNAMKPGDSRLYLSSLMDSGHPDCSFFSHMMGIFINTAAAVKPQNSFRSDFCLF